MKWLIALVLVCPSVAAVAQTESKYEWSKVVSSTGFSSPQFVGPDKDIAWIDSAGYSIVDPATGVVKLSFPARGATGEIWMAKDKSLVRYGTRQGLATYDLKAAKVTFKDDWRGPAAFSADGKHIAVALSDRVLVANDKLESDWSIEGASRPEFTSDGQYLATYDNSKGELTVVSTETKKALVVVKTANPGPVWTDGDGVFVAEANTVWSVASGEAKKVLSHPEGRARVESVAGDYVLFSTQRGSEVWRLSDGAKAWANEVDASKGALLMSDGKTALYAGSFAVVCETDGGKVKDILGVSGTPTSCEVSPDARYGYVKMLAQSAQYLVLCDMNTRKTVGILPTRDERPVFLKGGKLAHFSGKGIEMVDLSTMKTEHTGPWGDSFLAASSDGRILAVAPRSGHDLYLVDSATMRPLSHGSLSGPMDLALDSDGRTVAVTDSGVVRILPADTLSDTVKSKGQSGYRKGIFFVSGAKLLALISSEGFVGQQRNVLAFMDTTSGVVEATQVPAEFLHASPDRTKVAVITGQSLSVFQVPNAKYLGAVGMGVYGLRDGAPMPSGRAIWFGGETRMGVARLEMPKPKE
ncbi:MAG: hypothetical protein JSS66_04300 [Armatimonadetes bacterium]|nr:hypothetical protein [Armatimonadota bacterium]